MSVISVKNLSKTFQITQKDPGFWGSVQSFFHRKTIPMTAVDGVSFAIDSGELVGFIGPNGAGKTTTLKMLSGLLYPSEGKVKVLGYTPFERKREFLRQISLVMGQKNQLWWDLPAIDTFLLNKEIYEIDEANFKKTLDRLVDLLDVGSVLKTPVRKLSLGQRMKMELIAALLHQPKVLFLDEPTIGLDVVAQASMREFIKEYNKTYEATIILTSHYMEDVKELCKRVIMIDHGKVLFDGALTDLITKHTKWRRITLRLEKKVDEKSLSAFGILKKNEYPIVVLDVERDATKRIASTILATLPVADIEISEPKIEDVIRDVFMS
ncbi:ABC transporter ATP-binding protein [Candidatus Woesebacteria bacterium]|nr:ABC transporter ATP-binding protein [Candidatus Woesebacteria bacterium]